MKINIAGTIANFKGDPLKAGPEVGAEDVTYASVAINALQAPDNTVSRADGIKRFVFAVRIQRAVDEAAGEIEVTSGEATTLKNTIHKVNASPLLDARFEELIEGKTSALLKGSEPDEE